MTRKIQNFLRRTDVRVLLPRLDFRRLRRRFDVEQVRRRLTLRLALVCYVILPLIVAIGALGTLLLKTYEQRVEDQMKEDVQLIARALEAPVQRALERHRDGSLHSALESVIGINRVYGAYVYGPQGEMIASVGAANTRPDRRRLSTLAGEEAPQDDFEQISGRNVYSYFVPLTTSGQRSLGLLHVTRRERDIRTSVAGLRRQVAGLSALAVLFVAAMVLVGHRGAIGRHLKALQDSMRQIERGDVMHRAHLSGPHEVVELSHALNKMLDALERAEQEIEERREAEYDLQEKLRHAEKLAAIGTLSAGVAHELGTPLSVVEGRAHRMLRNERLPQDAAQAFSEIRSQVRRMERIITQLLDFGRKSSLHRTAVQPDLVARAAVRSLETHARERNVQLEVRSEPLPTPVLMDRVRLEQALANLIHNAVDAAAGGIVRVTTRQLHGEIQLAVDDSGPGISDKDAQHIFDPFYTTKPVGEGTGLGLAVVHGIAEEHGGRIDVERSDLGGARFVLRIPNAGEDENGLTARDGTSSEYIGETSVRS